MRVDALQPIVIRNAGHNIVIEVGVHHVTDELAKALGGDEPQADAARVTKLRLLSAVQVETQVAYLLSRRPLEQYVIFAANGVEAGYEHRCLNAQGRGEKQEKGDNQTRNSAGANASRHAPQITHFALPRQDGPALF